MCNQLLHLAQIEKESSEMPMNRSLIETNRYNHFIGDTIVSGIRYYLARPEEKQTTARSQIFVFCEDIL